MSLNRPDHPETSKQLVLFLCLLMLAILMAGCAATQEISGIPPTDLSSIYVGSQQSEVEKIVGKPIRDIAATDQGYYAIYRFDRGYKPYENYKGQRAALYEVINVMSLGSAYANRRRYQKALLQVYYDQDGALLYAEEWMENKCSNSPYAGKDCKATQRRWLHPSTLPLFVTKRYQLADPELKLLYEQAEKGDQDAAELAKIKSDFNAGLHGSSHIQNSKNEWKLKKEINTYCPNADLGRADAQKHIGDLHYYGAHGINKDAILAYVWYSLAAQGGNMRSREIMNLIIQELSPEQIIEAQKQLNDWVPGKCQRQLLDAAK